MAQILPEQGSPVTTNTEPRCEGCGSMLPSPDVVCPRCEAELTAERPRPTGKYVCPHCQQRFAAPAQVLWPPKVPWWRPTTIRQQCPHCEEPVRDRRELPFRGWLVVMALGLGVYLQEVVRSHQLFMKAYLLMMVAALAWLARREWKGTRDPHRFVVGTRRLWLRQPKDLSAAPPHRPE
jgi:hypothetical protein